MMKVASIAVACLVAACGQPAIEVSTKNVADYNRGALLGAVDQFVKDGRTPGAYRDLAQTVAKLRGGCDRARAVGRSEADGRAGRGARADRVAHAARSGSHRGQDPHQPGSALARVP